MQNNIPIAELQNQVFNYYLDSIQKSNISEPLKTEIHSHFDRLFRSTKPDDVEIENRITNEIRKELKDNIDIYKTWYNAIINSDLDNDAKWFIRNFVGSYINTLKTLSVKDRN